MRIACIHIPQFALQCATRLDPSLRGAPVAVVSGLGVEPGRERAGVLHAPIVLACSRAAWALGVRVGMTATAARALSPELEIVTAEATIERDAVRALGDALLALSPTVDLGGRVGAGGAHLAMYAEVPAKTRGHAFGERIVALLEELGYTARIGIADDRFTAWVAAAHSGTDGDGHVIAVPRGGSAAFLAPRPLSLLAITPEVQHMLEALGVRTLGEFAALPAPSVARPFEADYQALARGDTGARLRPYTPEAPVREDVVVSAGRMRSTGGALPGSARAGSELELDGSIGATAAIAVVARRLALRLAGRGRAAARLEVVVYRDEEVAEIPVSLLQAVDSPEELARALGPVLDSTIVQGHATAPVPPATSDRWRLRVTITAEAVIGRDGSITETLAEGSSPFARVAANSNATSESIYAPASSDAHGSSAATSSHRRRARAAVSSSDSGPLYAQAMQRAHNTNAAEPTRAAASSSQISHASTHASTLSVVLASTGSLFALSPPEAHTERRETHRRTRRGKQRRSRPTAATQPRLFDRASSASQK
jgi:hypothetical protein